MSENLSYLPLRGPPPPGLVLCSELPCRFSTVQVASVHPAHEPAQDPRCMQSEYLGLILPEFLPVFRSRHPLMDRKLKLQEPAVSILINQNRPCCTRHPELLLSFSSEGPPNIPSTHSFCCVSCFPPDHYGVYVTLLSGERLFSSGETARKYNKCVSMKLEDGEGMHSCRKSVISVCVCVG